MWFPYCTPFPLPLCYYRAHEWCKHGTCAMNAPSMSSIDSMIAYFTNALTLFETLDIDNSLSSAGVTHSNEYNLAKFNIFDKQPAFECTVC